MCMQVNLEIANAEVERYESKARKIEESGLGFAPTSKGEALQEQSRALQALLTAKIGKIKDELSKLQALPLTEIVIDPSTGRASGALRIRPTVAVIARDLHTEATLTRHRYTQQKP